MPKELLRETENRPMANDSPVALLTGGAGYVGAHVALALREAGWRIVVLDDLSAGRREGVLPECVFYEGEVGNSETLDSVFAAHRFSAVLHLAAVSSVPESVADPARCDKINRLDSQILINAARRFRVPYFIFSSTSVVYDEDGAPPFAEDSPLKPKSPYAASKLAVEQYLAAASAPRFAALRYFNVGGADPQLRAGNRKRRDTTLIKAALECAAGVRPRLDICGRDYPTADGTGVRDYIHVSDVAAAHVSALSYLQNGGASGAFNLGLGRGFSVLEVVAAAKRITGVDFPLRDAPRREGDPATIYGDPRKARRAFGFSPRFDSLETIVAHSWAWERALQKRGG
ncbi:MAG: UDP-glucose 4-epimerase GalE [Gammaproteobacteria bacterium]